MRELCTGHQAKSDRFCTGDGAIETGRSIDRIKVDLMQLPADFRGFAVSVTGVERGDVGLGQDRVLLELAIELVDQRLAIAVEHP